jgi:hypothetical protein
MENNHKHKWSDWEEINLSQFGIKICKEKTCLTCPKESTRIEKQIKIVFNPLPKSVNIPIEFRKEN